MLNVINLSKIPSFFKCLPEDLLQIRITDNNEVSFLNNYSLMATVNHSGCLNKKTLQGDFVNLVIVFGCDNPSNNPSIVQKLSWLTQFSGLKTLSFLVTKEALQGG